MSSTARTPLHPDLALRDRVVGGDRAAAEELVRAHLDPLYEFVHHRLGADAKQTEELVQECFLVALEKLPGYAGESTLFAWLCGIARNKLRAARRKKRPRLLADVLEDSAGDIDRILADVAREPLPDWALQRAETRELVGATLSSLPAEYRRALVEKYIEEKSVVEMAAGAGQSPKAAESMLHRARVSFARVFELLAKKRGGWA
jgi:RNA polymerase sigma-70 factor (ECF subfamily)